VTIIGVLVGLAVPWPLKFLVDNVLGGTPFPPMLTTFLGEHAENRLTLLVLVVLAGLLLTLTQNLLTVVGQYVNTKLEQQITLDFRRDLFAHTEQLSVPYVDRISPGRLMYAINFEATAAGRAIMALEPLARGALTLLGMVWISFQIDPVLAVLAIAVVPALYYLVGYYAGHIQPRLMHVKGLEADALSIVHNAMSMMRVISAFNREEYENRRYRHQGEEAVAARVNVTVRQSTFSMAVNMVTAIGTAMILGLGTYRALQGQLTVGQLLVVMSYIGAVYKPLEAISYTIGSLQDLLVGLQMGFHVMDTDPTIKDASDAVTIGRAEGSVTFEHVSFSYPGRSDVLHDISFEARPGQVIAMVGPTGAGKTTLMSLLPRFYDPSEGRILLGGIDLRSLTIRSLREQISLVPQEPVLSAGSILDNIRYGKLDATMDQVVEAARAANAHEFIMQLPEQYDTEVGERGIQLSGGERQRVCVARAFVKDAPILILDEPTSSIDSRTEAVILEALDRLMIGRTTFLIAHRLSTVRNADVILTLDQGRLVEQGSHADLLRNKGLYKQLHDLHTGMLRRRFRPLTPGTASTALADGGGGTPYDVEWLDHQIPARMAAGRENSVTVYVKNAGDSTWSSHPDRRGCTAPVYLSYHWLRPDGDDSVLYDGSRTVLPRDIASGETVQISDMVIMAPDKPGSYRLQLTLVHELVAWFEERGARTLVVPIDVSDDEAGSPQPHGAPERQPLALQESA
jgi:ATP-binding cassette, subfamily B, bacterial